MQISKLFLILIIGVSSISCTTSHANQAPTTEKVSQKVKKQTDPITSVTTNDFRTMISKKGTVLIDVRTPNEFVAGHIPNSENINVFGDFAKDIEKLSKDKTVYVYCRSGRRSMKAANILAGKGYTVVNLLGGFNGWARSGFKVEK